MPNSDIAHSITLSDLFAHGVEDAEATCERCAHQWRLPLAVLPGGITLAKAMEIMACTECGGGKISATPIWPAGALPLQ